jgi:membrane dipeptidase
MTTAFKGALLACAASLIAGSAFAHSSEVQAPMVPADIMALHQKMIVLDTHSDSPTETLRRPGFDITKRHSYAHDKSQIDLPRMNDGGYDGGWFVVYNDPVPLTKQGYETALADGLRKLTSVRRIAAEHPNDFEFATTPADVRRIVGSGKKAVLMSMEGSYDLGEDLKNLSAFHQFGVTMASPTHSKNSQFGDSATDKPKWNGLSPLGKQWVTEMNRLGIIIDVSHSSDQAIDDMLALSKAPIIASHHGAKAIAVFPRNLDDARLKAIAAKGGVIQVNSVFLGPDTKSGDAYANRAAEPDLTEIGPAEQDKALEGFRASYPTTGFKEKTTFEDFMKQLLYVLKLVGPDHVGVGPDWDGGGGMPGFEDISYLPKVTERLKKAGYSDADIGNIWSGNVLRVMAQVQAMAAK